jgi:tRNA (Thr-GGU) A37 N-methylase
MGRNAALGGVFAARAPHRPDPVGVHRAWVRGVSGNHLKVGSIEAIDGAPVIDIKAVRGASDDS